MTRVLLNSGINPNESNDLVKFGRSPLQKAVEDGNLRVIDLLLDAGADVNAPAAKHGGATSLQLAAITGRLGIARRLIDLGSNVNASGAETGGRTALEGAAEHGRLDMVQFLLECGANVVGDGCLQYFKAIIFARQQGHVVVANFLKNHREWTSFEHEIWELLITLDKDILEELESLEELVVSSAESSSSRYMNGDSPKETARLNEFSNCESSCSQEESSVQGVISPMVDERVDGGLGKLQNSWTAISAGASHDNMIVDDRTASHIQDNAPWNQQFGNTENWVGTSWDVGPIEAVHDVHVMQDFETTEINSQVESNQQPATANQDFQAVWDSLLIGGLDLEKRMEERSFPVMSVESSWDSQLGATDWNSHQAWLGSEMESEVNYRIFEGDVDWVETHDPSDYKGRSYWILD